MGTCVVDTTTDAPTTSEFATCGYETNSKKCNREELCTWVGSSRSGSCVTTASITTTPTLTPTTDQPTTSEYAACGYEANYKTCGRMELCTWTGHNRYGACVTTASIPIDMDFAIAGLYNADVTCSVIPSQNSCSHPLFGALCPKTCGSNATTVANWAVDNDDIVLGTFKGTCKQLVDASGGGQCFDSTGRAYTAVGVLCPTSCAVPLTLPACKCSADWKDSTSGKAYCSGADDLEGCPAAVGGCDGSGYVYPYPS